MKRFNNTILFFLCIVLTLFFFRESLMWFYKVLIGLHDLFNTVFLLLLLFLIAKNTSIKNEQFCFNYKGLPFIICCLSVFGHFISENFIHVHILSFIFFLTYLFGFLGFFIPNSIWKKYIIPLCLLIMILPFGNILDLYIGFPLRMVSVNLVSVFFEFFGVDHLSIDTIITIENNSSNVDFSCSGIKGIWAGLIFYFTHTWLKKITINYKWFGVGAILLFLIVLFNTIRILILVYFDLVLTLPKISAIIHVPLGIFGFVFSCTFIYFLSGYLLESKSIKKTTKSVKKQTYHFSYVFMVLPVIQILLSFYIPEKQSIEATRKVNYLDANFVDSWNITELESSNQESNFVITNGGNLQKFSFFNTNIKGTGFVFKSKTWRSHHNPENCITAGGRQLIKSETLQTDKTNTIKKIVLDNGQNGYYWFQNKQYTTDDFGTRIWNEIFKQQSEWFLVCVIFNAEKNNNQKEHFIKQIKNQL